MPKYPPCFVCLGPSEFEDDGCDLCRYCFGAFEELKEASHAE